MSLRIIPAYTVIVYAVISLGFSHRYVSQVKDSIWVDAFLKNQSAQNSIPVDNLIHDKQIVQSVHSKNIELSNATASADSNLNNTSVVSRIGRGSLINQDSLISKNSLISSDSLITKDTLAKKTDSLAVVDSMSIDSTARLKYFHYEREDLPYVTLKQKRMSKFFAQPSPTYKTRTVEIDSTGKYVIVKEIIAGQQTKILLRMPIDDYIQMSLALHERKLWEDLGYAYELKKNKRELSDIIKDITDFEIPLPSVGVLSIFGEPKISLKIGGAVDIHGAFRSETTQGVTTSLLGNTRSEPDFKQQVQINVNGTIGDKLNINADWNTERTFQYENQLKIKYTGYEDEIIQSIEAGNVSLETSPLIGGSEALFGLKAVVKMGPLTLTTLASQKKGETKEVSVSGGSTAKTFTKRAYDYSTNHYFVDTLYASTNPDLNLFYKYYGNPTPIVDPNYTIVDIQVWKSVNVITADNSKERNANVYINLPALSKGQTYDDINPSLRDSITAVAGQVDGGRFLLLEQGTDYILHPETGYITFTAQIQSDDIIAVAYRVQNKPSTSDDDSYYGEFVSASTPTDRRLVLKLIKPKNLQPSWTQAWKLQLKNIYPTDSRNIKEEGFEFNIKYQIEGQEPAVDIPTPSGQVRLLNAFGLDILDASKNSNPDNVFDFRPGITIIPATGEIIFPELEPFGRDLPEKIPKEFAFQDVYDTTSTSASNIKDKDKWILTGKSTGESTSSYSLGFNVVENSVKVSLDGRELTPSVDYTVDYNTGQLVIRNDAALVPGANLKITYEQNDLFQLASKTLLGARGTIDFSKKTKLGFTALNLNQQTLSDKVRIGEEPLSNSIYGVDFNTSADLPFLTKALDNIISTKQMSTFNLSGEYAYINPDPNTKKSTIVSDQGKSIAYIDDFEGAKRTIPIGISYTSWKDLSAPAKLEYLLSNLEPPQEMPYKAKAWWYTITPGDVQVNQIWPLRKASKQDQQVTVMDFVFQPDTPGTYNPNPLIHENLKQNWGGMMKLLSSTANNLVEQNIEYIEFWAHIDQAPSDAKVYIDLGNISEDVIPNRLLDTEDKKLNEVIDPGEDTGIDGIFDADERTKYGSTLADPNGDNFSYKPTNSHNIYDYFNINGTEGNANLSDNARIPDTEDLNRNGTLDLLNSYFRYAIPLDTTTANPYIAGGGDNAGWYLFRIPLKDTATVVGNPSLTNIETIRLFVTGVSSLVHIRLTEFNLVGSQWQKANKNDSTLSVSVISYEDNPSYTLPPGVSQERDLSHPDENVLQNEQSLDLIVNNLQDGESREAVKFLYSPLDVFNYSEMKLFIHGDIQNFAGSLSDTTNGKYASQVYFRFGTDSLNYYEYRQPVLPGWNEISIPFKEITSLKQTRGDSTSLVYELPVPGLLGHYYRLKGNPTLTAIQFLSVGIYNIKETGSGAPIPLSGEVWVNELRVIGADDSPGWAYSFNSSIRFADLFGLSFNMSKKNPYFHALSDRFGSRVESTNWSVATDFDVLKLLPFNLPESNLKINYSHSESLGKPLYIPGTDIRVDQAGRQLDKTDPDSITFGPKNSKDLENETQTLNISDSWSASNVKIKIPTNFWLIRDTFNNLTFGFNYNKTFSRNPTVLSNKAWVWNANIAYGLNLGPQYYFNPVDIPVLGSALGLLSDYRNLKVYFLPQSFTFNLTAKRNRNTNVTRARKISGQISDAQQVITRDFGTTRGFGFNWKVTEGGFLNLTTNYNVNINSSLAYLETENLFDKNGQVVLDQNGNPVQVQRSESDIWHDIFSRVWFGKDFAYQQNTEFKTSPRLPSFWDLNKYFTVTAGYSVGYNWNFDFRSGDLGRSAGFASKSNVGFTLRLKALTEPLFRNTETSSNKRTENFSNNRNIQNRFGDTSKTLLNDSLAINDTSKGTVRPSPIKNAALFLESLAKSILFDYESITINFTNNHNLSKSGIAGTGTGFSNFWGFTERASNGPTRAFMLGLSDDVGDRIALPSSNVSDIFSNSNNIDLRTSRPLWEGAKIDLNWKVGWTLNKTTSFRGDDNGNLVLSNVSSTGSLSRSFLSLPPFLFLSVFKNGIKKVNELYDPNSTDPGASLSSAFVQGFETFPWLSKLGFFKDVVKYIPRPNWSITWDGLEKFFLFKKFAKKVSFNHVYSSTYTEGWRINPDGVQETQSQRIDYGFTPLAGLNFTFGDLWGGNLISSVKYSTNTDFDLGISNQNITQTFSRDIGITAGYSKSGFELPLFGLSLKNDIEFTFSYTSTENSIVRYEMNNFTEEGIPQDGTTRTTIEPRIKYTISSKVTLSIFYRRSSVQPEGASRVTPTVTNEAGLDVHISIQ